MEMFQEKSKSVSVGRSKRTGLICVFLLLPCVILSFILGAFQQKTPFFEIPIVITPSGLICIQAEIQGEPYLFEIDSGGSCCFSLKKEFLDKINCIEEKIITRWSDINGNEYISPVFLVDLIQIQKMNISNVGVIEENPYFHDQGSNLTPNATKKKCDDSAGRIGAVLLRQHDYWLIDFPNKSLVVFKDSETIKNNRKFSFEKFAEVALEPIEPHIVINIETDFGLKRFAIDTGAYRSVLRTPPELQSHEIISTNRFSIGGHDFGAKQLYLFDMSARMERFDGFLGRDFLQNHAVYLDFKNKKVFVGPSKGI